MHFVRFPSCLQPRDFKSMFAAQGFQIHVICSPYKKMRAGSSSETHSHGVTAGLGPAAPECQEQLC